MPPPCLGRRRSLLLLASLLATPWACSEGTAADARSGVLHDIAHNVFVPASRAMAVSQAALRDAILALVADPTPATLQAAQDAWRAARGPLKHTQTLYVGPTESLRLRSALDWFPPDPNAVVRTLQGTAPLTALDIASLGSTARGMPALEWLLFGPARDPGAVLQALRDGSGTRRYRTYLEGVAGYAVTRAEAIADAWDPARGNHARELSEAGRGSLTHATARAAIDALVNGVVGVLENAAAMRLGVPLGMRDGGIVQPDRVESPWSDNALRDLHAIVDGADAVYTGVLGTQRGRGLSDLVRARSTTADDTIRAQTQTVRARLQAIPEPLREAVRVQPDAVRAAHEAIAVWRTSFQTDVSTLLGVTLGFTDNDGD